MTSVEQLLQVARDFHQKTVELSTLRQQAVGEELPLVTARILGQFALLANTEACKKLKPIATRDLDIQFVGGVQRDIFKTYLLKAGFVLDANSDYIWIVPGAKFDNIFESSFLRIEVIQPLYNLVSKAVKAPEKNRNLIRQGLKEYGLELFKLIKEHGGDLRHFE